MRNHLKIIAYAALIVAIGAVMVVTSTESALRADRAAYAIVMCSNPIIEAPPSQSKFLRIMSFRERVRQRRLNQRRDIL